MTQVHFHDVISITLGPIRGFPRTASGDGPFWTLEMIFKDAHGGRSRLLVYANAREHLDLAPDVPHPLAEDRAPVTLVHTGDARPAVA